MGIHLPRFLNFFPSLTALTAFFAVPRCIWALFLPIAKRLGGARLLFGQW